MKKQKRTKTRRFKEKDIENFCESVKTILTKINERCGPRQSRETA